mgnify:FL=1
MPVVKYRTLATRETQAAFNIIYGALQHLAPFGLDLKAVNAIGSPESGYILELSDAMPVEQLAHLELELIG